MPISPFNSQPRNAPLFHFLLKILEFLNFMMSQSHSLCALFFVAVIALSVSSANGFQFKVGDGCGWSVNHNESYNHWAERNRFQVNDTLYFKYDKNIDSVLIVNKFDYEHCDAVKPLLKLEGGDSVFKFDRSGPFFFITSNVTNCQKGQKLIVVVLAVRHHRTPATPPSPYSTPTPSPAYGPSGYAPQPGPSSSEDDSPKKKKNAGTTGTATVVLTAVCAVLGGFIV